ncbi:hypothetical protein [Parafilimonas terrae]|uniref:Uncharacterized protein n=1 Tax=Parafilimonas terrae TaxID=1465490 RepID=A0A1I5TCB6_9BACT|nr:hypothetical protein [Parafilimonas terrae]SFP80685.1 hypothetical protein SAMN05444277_10248 [Parafilimonas terrae]
MKEINLKNIPAGTHEMMAWLIVLMIMVFGYKYLREFVEYVLLKFYEYFIQHKF